MNQGRVIILGMLVLGCAVGGLSVWLHHQMSRRPLGWWSSEARELIQTAPRVDALRLAPPPATGEDASDVVTVGGKRSAVVSRVRNLEGIDGMSHLRDALLEDANFDWTAAAPAKPPQWQYGLELRDGQRRLAVVFDFNAGVLGSTDGDRTLKIAKVAQGWQEFFAERFPEAAAKRQ
jgi:hypothetical protein